ncbi:acetylgalactosamine 3-beta-galactosyltransferase 1 [Seminavis robusta]|uniref:Acetylgalactosamine 3-beta-galactosyltransferase 1 n=1 Tax=Seminavis robusta TaxID=568900 RepID=A0A9N8DG42_9STRA|nr:acetylgalactosamine 3-beta-galactosyltransferase 1 [Seminavis robusta]|eukprot:Sro109_g054410.1 acetylgalactosamine 3-beta-galactosyltransferase 1 (464) ;mRNA; r:10417-11808
MAKRPFPFKVKLSAICGVFVVFILGLDCFQIDLSFTDTFDSVDSEPSLRGLQQPPKPHPHAGAKDSLGNYGYVHDPSIIRRAFETNSTLTRYTIAPHEYESVCAPRYEGPEGYFGYQALTQKLNVPIKPPSKAAQKLRVFCGIYTHPGAKAKANLQAIRETWGPRCDGFMAASTETDADTGVVHIPHFGGFEGKYKNIWQKVRSMLGYVADNFADDYDFFHFLGDDTFLIMEHLKEFLVSDAVLQAGGGPGYPKPVYTGNWMKCQWLTPWMFVPFVPWNRAERLYMSGGSGYTLSRSALQHLVRDLLPICEAETIAPWEDYNVGQCFAKSNYSNTLNNDDSHEPIPGLLPVDSRDAAGAQRYHTYELDVTASGLGYLPMKQFEGQSNAYGFDRKYGLDTISSSAISFHYLQSSAVIRRYEKLLYRRDLDSTDCPVEVPAKHGGAIPYKYWWPLWKSRFLFSKL